MVASDTILVLALCAHNLIQSNQHGRQAQRHWKTDKGCEYVAKRYEGCEIAADMVSFFKPVILNSAFHITLSYFLSAPSSRSVVISHS